jgi:hypothetical protein
MPQEKQAGVMWVARDGKYGGADYQLCRQKHEPSGHGWWDSPFGAHRLIAIGPAQSPVALEPGQGPVRVRLVEVE